MSGDSIDVHPPPRRRQSVSSKPAPADNTLAIDLDLDSTQKLCSLASDEVDRIINVKQFQKDYAFPPALRRTQSLKELIRCTASSSQESRWPRYLSFSTFIDVAAAEAHSDWASTVNDDALKDPTRALAREKGLVLQAQIMAENLQRMQNIDGSIVEEKVNDVVTLDEQSGRNHEILESTYQEKLQEFNSLRGASDNLLSEERTTLTESVKDVENLGAKLEYELDALQSKVEDMENGILEYERQLTQLESRAAELDEETEDSWFQWCYNFLTGKD